jgi:DNA-binding winged helix-turn-helix (wHTH) protein
MRACRLRIYRFSNFELDLDLFTLARDGDHIHVGRRILDLLVCLIQNRDRVVTPDFLRDEVWGGVALSESTIPTAISDLRKALGDNTDEPEFIETIRGRGYRFVMDARVVKNRCSQNLRPDHPFVGRSAELNLLYSMLKNATNEPRRHTVILRGESGIGKSALLHHFLNLLPNSIKVYVGQSRIS